MIMPSFHQLPGELIALVCDELSVFHYQLAASPGLVALCRVSSRMRAFSQPALYRNVGALSGESLMCFLRTVTGSRPDLGRHTQSFTQTCWNVRRYQRKLIKMALKLHIPGVHKAHVTWGFEDDAHLVNTLAAIVLAVLPNLKHLSWGRENTDSRILALENLQQKLQSVTLVGRANFQAVRALCQLPTLRTLGIEQIYFCDRVYFNGLYIPKESIAASHLELAGCHFEEGECTTFISAFESLETLHITGGSSKPQFLASALELKRHTLKELVWKGIPNAAGSPTKFQIRSLLFLDALRHLDIHQSGIGNVSRHKATFLDATRQKDKELLTDFLPSGLESLVIRGVDSCFLRAVARLVRKCPAIYSRLHDVRLHIREPDTRRRVKEPDSMLRYKKLEPAFEERRIHYEVVEEEVQADSGYCCYRHCGFF